MKIRVIVDKYEHQGLYKGGEYEAEYNPIPDTYTFVNCGKVWILDATDAIDVKLLKQTDGPIKSDGGSSSYYDLNIPEWLLYTLSERQKEGKCYIKTEEMISAFLSNDFDYGNLFKSMVRCKGLQDGTGGKAGNSVEYECNKMIYSVNKIKEKK